MPKLYDSYLNALGIPGTERQQVMEALIDFATLRYQMLGTLLEGSLSPDEAVSVFGADALALNMQDSLTAAQQDELRLYDQLLKQDTLREVYQQALQRTGSAISGSVQNRVSGRPARRSLIASDQLGRTGGRRWQHAQRAPRATRRLRSR